MAAQYTEVSLDDMEKFLKRGFRGLRPKQGVQYGEYYYDLPVTDYLMIRVWTSIRRGSGTGAGVGEDAIRVQLMSIQAKKPVLPGKAPIVKRTQGWRNSLQDKIESAMETAEEMAAKGEERQQHHTPADELDDPTNDGESSADDMPEERPREESPLYGTFTNFRNEWCARIPSRGEASSGRKAILETKNRRRVPVTLRQKVWSGNDRETGGPVEIWTIDQQNRTATEEPSSGGYSYDRTV